MQTKVQHTCILHIGMPKTGTSAIQRYLCYELEDPAFRYVNFGREDGSGIVGLATIFSDVPADWYFHKKAGLSEAHVAQLRASFLDILEKDLLEATQHNQVLLLSSEYCWNMNASEFSRIRTYLESYGFSVQVVGYIRPWKAWLESRFQQHVKGGDQKKFLSSATNTSQLDYQQKFQMLEHVFEKGNVHFYGYDPKRFPDTCIVQDFCRQVGIAYTNSKVRRVNESLALPAIQLLYAAIKYRPGFEINTPGLHIPEWLRHQLQTIDGPPLRFHSSLVEPLIEQYRQQAPWLKEQVGVSLEEDLYAFDDTAIRSETDLLHFSPAAIAWLQDFTGEKLVHPMGSHDFTLEVANRMLQLIALGERPPTSEKRKHNRWYINWLNHFSHFYKSFSSS